MKYYLQEFKNSQHFNISDKWIYVVNYALVKANYIEFNVLFVDENYDHFIKRFSKNDIAFFEKKEKFYSSGKIIRLKLDEEIKEFILSKKYEEWKNFCLEDISFYVNHDEIVATITHEDYLFLKLNEEEKEKFKSKGFDLLVVE